jgi:hypothetical protein
VVNTLAGCPIRPLWHLSGTRRSLRQHLRERNRDRHCRSDAGRIDNLRGGTVAEWTIAAALKAAGRKARGFESLPFRSIRGLAPPLAALAPHLPPGSLALARLGRRRIEVVARVRKRSQRFRCTVVRPPEGVIQRPDE